MLYSGNREPPLEELFEDPMVQLVMRRDGLSAEDVRSCIERARCRLNGQPDPHRRAGTSADGARRSKHPLL